MANDYEILRTAALAYLREVTRNPSRERYHTFNEQVVTAMLANTGLHPHAPDIWKTAVAVFHELYLERIIVWGDAREGIGGNYFAVGPLYQVTDHGRRVLTEDGATPHDPSGFLVDLQSRVPALDGTVLHYLGQSLECYKRDCNLAAAVMLGCAAEKILLLVIEQFGDAIRDPAKQTKYKKETDESWQIKTKYDKFWKWFEPALAKDFASRETQYTIRQNFEGSFQLIRRIRNSAGHPSETNVTRDDVYGCQILFRSYCRCAYDVIELYQRQPASV